MLSNELYSKFDINYNNSHYSEKNNTKNKISNKISNNMSLFWTFYLIIYDSYNSEKMFKIKNDYAIKFIEKLKNNNSILKQNRVTLNHLEQSLLYDTDISLNTLKIMTLAHNINLIYILGNKYYLFISNEDDLYSYISNQKNVITYETNITHSKLDDLKKTFFYIENTKKIMNSVSYYKLDQIKEMCFKLNIDLYDNNGKKKNKQELYQEISECLMQN
jgi:hypothetical protein